MQPIKKASFRTVFKREGRKSAADLFSSIFFRVSLSAKPELAAFNFNLFYWYMVYVRTYVCQRQLHRTPLSLSLCLSISFGYIQIRTRFKRASCMYSSVVPTMLYLEIFFIHLQIAYCVCYSPVLALLLPSDTNCHSILLSSLSLFSCQLPNGRHLPNRNAYTHTHRFHPVESVSQSSLSQERETS